MNKEPTRCFREILRMGLETQHATMIKLVGGFYDVIDGIEDDAEFSRLEGLAEDMNELVISLRGQKDLALKICNRVCLAESMRVYLFDDADAIRASMEGK